MDVINNYKASNNLFEDLKKKNPTGTVVIDLNENGTVKNWVVVHIYGAAESKPGSGERLVYPGASISYSQMQNTYLKDKKDFRRTLIASWITAAAAIVATVFIML